MLTAEEARSILANFECEDYEFVLLTRDECLGAYGRTLAFYLENREPSAYVDDVVSRKRKDIAQLEGMDSDYYVVVCSRDVPDSWHPGETFHVGGYMKPSDDEPSFLKAVVQKLADMAVHELAEQIRYRNERICDPHDKGSHFVILTSAFSQQ